MSTTRSATAYTRTQRRHLETIEEVKEIARERLIQDGLGGLSLRAIARDMGVVPSALYRYFPSHAHLLDSIADDAATSMLDHIQQAIDAVPEKDHREQWFVGLRAYRSWALDHVPGYSLNFGDLSGERSGSGEPDAIVRQVIEILGQIVTAASRAGVLDRSQTGVGRRIVHQLGDDCDEHGLHPAQVRAATLSAWSAVHGTVALEVSGRLPDIGVDRDAYFEAQLLGIARAVGFRVD